MRSLPFKTVAVFTSTPFQGNPVAVVLDARGLDDAQMQQIARWMNLSETTFVLPPTQPQADYRLRIFTPAAELPFAGHPTIGSAHALLEAGLIAPRGGVLQQECAAGLVSLSVSQDEAGERHIGFALPAPVFTHCDGASTQRLASLLGVSFAGPAIVVDVGPRWVVAPLANAQAVLDARPDLAGLKQYDREHGYTGVAIFGDYASGHQAQMEVRAFAPTHGVDEDPVCGSGNGAIAAYLRHTGLDARYGAGYVASEGCMTGRSGLVQVGLSEAAIRIGGRAVTCIEGSLRV